MDEAPLTSEMTTIPVPVDVTPANDFVPADPVQSATLGFDPIDSSSGSLMISGITAKGHVEAQLDKHATRITADRLLVDPQQRQVQLFGKIEQQAQIDRPDGGLQGGYIVMDQSDQSVHVIGPGTFTIESVTENTSEETSEKTSIKTKDLIAPADAAISTKLATIAASDKPTRHRIDVTWTKAMHVNDRQGIAHFVGHVQTNGQFERESVRLSAQDLRMEFIHIEPPRQSTTKQLIPNAPQSPGKVDLSHVVTMDSTDIETSLDSSAVSSTDSSAVSPTIEQEADPARHLLKTAVTMSNRRLSSRSQDGIDHSEGHSEGSSQSFPAATDHKTDDSPLSRMARGGRAVSSVVASQDVVLLAETWIDHIDGELATRLRIAGPLMLFDNAIEQVQIVGPGNWLIEDYRPARIQDDEPIQNMDAHSRINQDRVAHGQPTTRHPTGDGLDSPIQLFRRGISLARWEGRMLLDAAHNDMRMEDRVQVIHRGLSGQEPMQIDCRQLLVDLEATGGLGIWLSGKAPQPQIKGIYADRDVRLLSGKRTVFCDQMSFTGFDQVIMLRSSPGNLVQIQDTDRPSAVTADMIHWDLTKNRVEVVRPGGGRTSLR